MKLYQDLEWKHHEREKMYRSQHVLPVEGSYPFHRDRPNECSREASLTCHKELFFFSFSLTGTCNTLLSSSIHRGDVVTFSSSGDRGTPSQPSNLVLTDRINKNVASKIYPFTTFFFFPSWLWLLNPKYPSDTTCWNYRRYLAALDLCTQTAEIMYYISISFC